MRTRLALLGGQAVCLGLTSCFLVVAATSVFLSTYGVALLPYAYLTVALAGVVVSSAMSRLQRHLSLAGLALAVVGVVVFLLTAGWAAVAVADQVWVTFPLVVLFFLWIPVGFLLIGAQSGRLLDIAQLKAYFPRVAAGFAAGFVLGGLLAARLVTLLGSPADLLLVDAGIALVLLGLVMVTARRHPDELRAAPTASTSGTDVSAPRPSLKRLLSHRLVLVLLGYQLLSAAVTQLLDFLVWQQAATRYPDPADLARFLGLFGAVINIVGLLFVFLVAGVLLPRYGMRLGLPANPAGVLVLVVLSTVLGVVAGPTSTLFFLLLCAQQVVDLALTDGTTRGSINAVYQALPPLERLAAQTRVEGVGVPAAIGCVGVLLLVFDRLHAGSVAVLAVVLVATIAWLALALTAYSLYGTNLRRTITRRAWDPVALRLDDDASRGVVEALLHSEDARDVAVAIDALAAASPRDVLPQLERLLGSDDPARRSVAVDAARRHRVPGMAPGLLSTATDELMPVGLRAAALSAAAAVGVWPAELAPMLADDSADVRASAAVALLHVRSTTEDADLVSRLLVGDGPKTSRAALTALTELPHVLAVPGLLELAVRPAAPRALTDALAAHGSHLLPATRAALTDGAPSTFIRRLLAAVALAPDPEALSVLLDALSDNDREVGRAARRALVSRGSTAGDSVDDVRAALARGVSRTARTLDALKELRNETQAHDVCRALRDDLRDTADECGLLIGMLHGPALVARAVRQLAGPGRALAVETLEVTLGRSDATSARALLDPGLTESARRAALLAAHPATEQDADAWLVELALDPDDWWREPWLRAAGLWALVRSGSPSAELVAASIRTFDDVVVAETAEAALAR